MELKTLFSPYKIGNCTIPNRLVVPAMVVNYGNNDGTASEKFIAYHEEKAKGGWGLIITEDYAVMPHAMGYKYIGGLWNDRQTESHRRLTERVHKYASKIFCQLYHAGRQSNSAVNGGVEPWAPSSIPCPWMRQIPREITRDEIHEVVEAFGKAAARAQAAGFDGVEIHAAHGYLLHEFLSSNTNKRTDEYGGCLANRARIVREVIDSVRANVGMDFPVTIRVSAFEFVPGGRSLFESRALFRLFEDWGADAIHVSSGMYGNGGIISPMFMEHGWITNCAQEAKEVVEIPVITVNRLNDPLQAEDIIISGIADFVAMGRGSLADPGLPNKAKTGRYAEIRQCIACLQGCVEQLGASVDNCVRCLVNPKLGHEFEIDTSLVENPKKIWVAGGGPGGMQAAIAARERGHEVTLFERSDQLGGQFRSAAYPPYKGDFASFTAWQINELRKSGAKVMLNTALTPEMVDEGKPDKVIVATGAIPIIPEVPGIGGPNVICAEDALLGKYATGDHVCIIGGGMIGTETAALLSEQAKGVTLVEMRPRIAADLFEVNREGFIRLLEKNRVRILTDTSLFAITEQGALLKKHDTVTLCPCDTVILAIGTCPYDPLTEPLKAAGIDVVTIGDAKNARKAMDAVNEGFWAGNEA